MNKLQFSPAKESLDHSVHKSMIIFNGWISVQIAEESDITEKELIPQLAVIFQKVKKYNPFCEIIKPGGNLQLQIAGSHNHDTGYSTDLKELLEKIIPIAPESYGIIYVRWPEHEQLWNQFKVYKLAQGEVTIEDDIYLSPCNPVIEKPF